MLRRLAALVATIPLLLLSLQGGAMACLQETAAAGAPGASVPDAMAGMHHDPAMHGAASGDRAASHAPAPSSDHDRSPHAPCPDRHSLASCASMPSCGSVTALPALGAPAPAAAERAIVALAPLAAPRAWGAAPELPPPRA